MTGLEKVRAELLRYDHRLLSFAAEEHGRVIELVISLKEPLPGVHTYRAPVHERDIAHPQFPRNIQRYHYECLHDYLVELFERTPQMKEQ